MGTLLTPDQRAAITPAVAEALCTLDDTDTSRLRAALGVIDYDERKRDTVSAQAGFALLIQLVAGNRRDVESGRISYGDRERNLEHLQQLDEVLDELYAVVRI